MRGHDTQYSRACPPTIVTMSQSTLKNRKVAAHHAQTTAAAVDGDYVPMEAQSTAELYGSYGASSRQMRNYSFFTMVGKHASPPPHAYLYNGFMEVVGVFVLGLVTTLGWFVAGPTTNLINGLALGAAVAGAYAVMSRIYSDYALRRHLNPGVTLVRLCRRDIGGGGALYYWACQLIGAIFCGLVVGAILSQQDGGCATSVGCVIQRATVPLPTTTNGAYGYGVSLTTVICGEIFFSMIIYLVLDLAENLNTAVYRHHPQRMEKHYHHAVKWAAGATLVLIAVGYPFQIGSYNGMTYLAGVFSGIVNAPYGRAHEQLAYLPSTLYLANSAFNGSAAWALYFFSSLAGGLAAAIVGGAIMYVGFQKDNQVDVRVEQARARGYEIINPGMKADITSSPLLVASQTTHTAVSDLVNPYSVNSGIASSVLLK